MVTKTCFITLSRSDYSSLRPVIRAAHQDPDIDVAVVVGGSHLLERFGNSIEDIKRDAIGIDKVIDFLAEQDDSDTDFSIAYARVYQALVEYFDAQRPDSVFILGDRWEMLAVATAASLLRIPIIHHSGGDITQGSRDNQMRYALSVLAHIHLVAVDQHRDRLLQMGEEDWRVICVGEPALTEIPSQFSDDIGAELGLAAGAKFVLATYHPTSFDAMSFTDQVNTFGAALDQIEWDIILTAPNPDPGSNTTYQQLQQYAQSRPHVHLFENLGLERYYAAMDAAEFMIGNSSSGIWEAPSFGLPVINMGCRQQDRLRAGNVIDVALDPGEVAAAIAQLDPVRSSEAVRQKYNPYVRDDTLELILNAIKLNTDTDRLLAKHFVDPLTRH